MEISSDFILSVMSWLPQVVAVSTRIVMVKGRNNNMSRMSMLLVTLYTPYSTMNVNGVHPSIANPLFTLFDRHTGMSKSPIHVQEHITLVVRRSWPLLRIPKKHRSASPWEYIDGGMFRKPGGPSVLTILQIQQAGTQSSSNRQIIEAIQMICMYGKLLTHLIPTDL